jgi:16S rRNA (guanine966-N2)-methyltransferase
MKMAAAGDSSASVKMHPMRIIAGEFRGRRLLAPRGSLTRPITDRVKQSVFDILAALPPAELAYDCFAGTGSLGLEALSRGAQRVIFFESDRGAAARLRRNLADLSLGARAQVVGGDLFSILDQPPAGNPRSCSLLFLDPPYRFVSQRPGDLRRLARGLAQRHLAAGATVVFRHALADDLHLPPLRRYDFRAYGAMAVEFLTCPCDPTNSSPPPTPLA